MSESVMFLNTKSRQIIKKLLVCMTFCFNIYSNSRPKKDEWPIPTNFKELLVSVASPWAFLEETNTVTRDSIDGNQICTTTKKTRVNPILVILGVAAIGGLGILGIFMHNKVNPRENSGARESAPTNNPPMDNAARQ